MKFKDKKTEEKTLKHFSEYGNPMGWHEVAFDLDFMDAFNGKNKENNDKDNLNKTPENKKGGKKTEKLRKEGIGTYDMEDPL